MAGTGKVVVANPSMPRRRRRRRRRNNPLHPAVAGLIGSAGGGLLGAGADVALGQTTLKSTTIGAIELGAGVALGGGLSFVSPIYGAGVGAGVAAPGAARLLLWVMAPKSDQKKEEQQAAIHELRLLRQQRGVRSLPAASRVSELVTLDEAALAAMG